MRAHRADVRSGAARNHDRFLAFHGEKWPGARYLHPVVRALLRGKIAFATGVRVVSPYCILRGCLYLPPSTDPFPYE
jgi:hypothetical protein